MLAHWLIAAFMVESELPRSLSLIEKKDLFLKCLDWEIFFFCVSCLSFKIVLKDPLNVCFLFSRHHYWVWIYHNVSSATPVNCNCQVSNSFNKWCRDRTYCPSVEMDNGMDNYIKKNLKHEFIIHICPRQVITEWSNSSRVNHAWLPKV